MLSCFFNVLVFPLVLPVGLLQRKGVYARTFTVPCLAPSPSCVATCAMRVCT